MSRAERAPLHLQICSFKKKEKKGSPLSLPLFKLSPHKSKPFLLPQLIVKHSEC